MTTDYLLDINRGLTEVIGEIRPDGETYYLLGLDMLGQQDITTSTTTWSYYGADHLGSVRTLTDAAGRLTAHTSYDPYGNLLHHAQQPDTPTTSLGYTGEMTDPSELVYLRARYYNSATATFLSRDPFPGYAHLALSRNGYSYVHGNSVNYVDPSGMLNMPRLPSTLSAAIGGQRKCG